MAPFAFNCWRRDGDCQLLTGNVPLIKASGERPNTAAVRPAPTYKTRLRLPFINNNVVGGGAKKRWRPMSDEAQINKPKVTAAAIASAQSGSVIVSHFAATCGNSVILPDADQRSRGVFNTPCVSVWQNRCLTWSSIKMRMKTISPSLRPIVFSFGLG